MVDGQESITKTERKPSKQIMLRLPEVTVQHIDEYAGDTHSSRPDFITDAVRQYIRYILRESTDLVFRIDAMDVSQAAKAAFYGEYMGQRVFSEFEAYRSARRGKATTKDISVLISIPWGLDAKITETVSATGLFKNNQEFIKVAIEYMFRYMSDEAYRLEFVGSFQSKTDTRKALNEELKQIRKELENSGITDGRRRPSVFRYPDRHQVRRAHLMAV
ncbi:MAG: hypothetical protein Q4Q62_07250 [Thermoplasmata archaeon]|nr:hypothetical protein [Thermoplasmata archaeon]